MRRLCVGLLLAWLALAVYLHDGRFNESTDTFGNELLPISILHYGTLTFDQYFTADGPAPGAMPDEFAYRTTPDAPNTAMPWWFAQVNGRVVSHYPIVPGLLNVPVFWVADHVAIPLADNVVPLTQITTSVMAALSVLFMYLCLIQVCRVRTAAFLTLAFAFATAVWSANSRSLNQHGPALLFITAALAALLTRRPRLVALAGVLLGLAVVTRPANIVVVAPIALYVLRYHRPTFVRFAAMGAIPGVFLLWYSWAYWGTPLAMGQGQGVAGFTAPEPGIALVGLLVNPNRGLFTFSPIFLLAVVCYVSVLRRNDGPPVLRYLVWSCLGMYLMYTLWSDRAAGHSYGYRYLIEIVPALILPTGVGWERIIQPRPHLRALFMVAMLASVYVHGLGAIAAPCGFDDDPDNIDFDHARLWDVAHGEVARCTVTEVDAWSTRLAAI
jgi:hypothetical protein